MPCEAQSSSPLGHPLDTSAVMQDIIRKAIQPLHTFFLSLLLPSSNPSSASSPTATTTPSGLPKPGRPLRHLVARILVTLHRRVESRSLFDFIQAILKALQDGAPKNMSQVEGVQRVAGWEVVGEVMRDLGTNVRMGSLLCGSNALYDMLGEALRCGTRWCTVTLQQEIEGSMLTV